MKFQANIPRAMLTPALTDLVLGRQAAHHHRVFQLRGTNVGREHGGDGGDGERVRGSGRPWKGRPHASGEEGRGGGGVNGCRQERAQVWGKACTAWAMPQQFKVHLQNRSVQLKPAKNGCERMSSTPPGLWKGGMSAGERWKGGESGQKVMLA